MKFGEVPNPDLEINPPKMLCDDEIANDIPEPLERKPHVYLIVGAKGSGKSSLMVSLLTSKKKPYKAYRGKFHSVLLNMPKSSADSIKGKPFASLPASNFYSNFNEAFLDKIYETAEENTEEEHQTLCILDDCSSKLKTNRAMIDKLTLLVHKHRHLRLSIWILVQDLISCPLAIRKNCCCLAYFRPTNEKSNQIFREEFLGGFSLKDTADFMDYMFKKKGDCLWVRLSTIPYEYYRNYNLINITHE